jgi:anti-sigma-K factor RskA
MNYANPLLLDALSERFVLGTMSRRARRRFNRLIDERPDAMAAVVAVEEMLMPLAWSLPAVQPSELVWQRIVRQAKTKTPGGATTATRFSWPLLAAAMSFAFVVSTLGWWREWSVGPEIVVETVVESVALTPAIGVIEREDGAPIWVARIYNDLQRADITVNNLPEARDKNDYQLWILQDDGVPVSLGLLPQSGDRSLSLDADAVAALGRGSTLAVSLEPLGGSPEPVPTGAVLYTTALLAP